MPNIEILTKIESLTKNPKFDHKIEILAKSDLFCQTAVFFCCKNETFGQKVDSQQSKVWPRVEIVLTNIDILAKCWPIIYFLIDAVFVQIWALNYFCQTSFISF